MSHKSKSTNCGLFKEKHNMNLLIMSRTTHVAIHPPSSSLSFYASSSINAHWTNHWELRQTTDVKVATITCVTFSIRGGNNMTSQGDEASAIMHLLTPNWTVRVFRFAKIKHAIFKKGTECWTYLLTQEHFATFQTCTSSSAKLILCGTLARVASGITLHKGTNIALKMA